MKVRLMDMNPLCQNVVVCYACIQKSIRRELVNQPSRAIFVRNY